MSKAHPTLLFRPQTPMPLATSQKTIAPRSAKPRSARPKQIHQPLPGFPSIGFMMSSVILRRDGSPSTQRGGGRTWTAEPAAETGLVLIAVVLIATPYASVVVRIFLRYPTLGLVPTLSRTR